MNLLVSLGAAVLACSSPGAVSVRHDLVYAPGARGRLDLYMPKRASRAPVAIFLYGGSWQSGDKALYRFVGVSLASRGIVAVIPDYRVFPEVVYPVFLRDKARAAAFVKAHAKEWGGDPDRMFLIGHSAGAYDAAMLAVDRRWLGEVGLDPRADIAGMLGLAGPYDFLPLRDPKLKVIFGPEAALHDTQPINHVDGAAPPLLLLAGDNDVTVDPGNSKRLADSVRRHGGVASSRLYPGLGHVTLLTSMAGIFRQRGGVLDEITAFVNDARPPTTAPVSQAHPSALQPLGAAE